MTTHVSIVMPVLNVRDWLPATLHSVLAQACSRDELDIVIVDDGSTDDTVEIARRTLTAGGLEHTVLRMDESRGPSAARNVGWRHARGPWIQFLDGDDLLSPHKIARQARAAAEAGPDVAAVFSRWGRLVQTAGEWVEHGGETEPSLGDDPILTVLTADDFIHIGSQLFARAWLGEVGGFDERHRMIEDVDLQLRLLMRGATFKPVSASRPTFWYRQRPGSLSRSDARGFREGCARNAQLAEAYWRGQGGLTPRRSAFLAEQYFSAARGLVDVNPALFGDLVERIYALCPTFEPPQRSLRVLSRLVGYYRAEQLVLCYRRLRGLFHRDRGPSVSGTPRPISP